MMTTAMKLKEYYQNNREKILVKKKNIIKIIENIYYQGKKNIF